MVDNLLPEHVELPHILFLAVHLVQLTTWMGWGGHTETFSLSVHLFYLPTSFLVHLYWKLVFFTAHLSFGLY